MIFLLGAFVKKEKKKEDLKYWIIVASLKTLLPLYVKRAHYRVRVTTIQSHCCNVN